MFSVGHSSHPLERFLQLLTTYQIEVLVDVRSQPYSRFSSHFNRETLEHALRQENIKYLFMGEELGGRPEGDDFYDSEGHVRYRRVAESVAFLGGIRRLELGIARYRTAVMCSEEDPTDCHRHLLVGRVLAKRGVIIHHIRGDGRLELAADMPAPLPSQMRLFQPDIDAWRSIAPVRRLHA
jgi:uncharacterized protein (DUF488 family)